MTAHRRPPTRLQRHLARRADRSRGAVMVEFALALPFMMLIAMGIVEMGVGWMTTNDVNAVARDAARTGTSAPAYLTADRSMLRSIGAGLSPKELAGLKRVIVFKATSASAAVPPNCLSVTPSTGTPGSIRGVSGQCNVYGPGAVNYVLANPADLTYFGGTEASGCSGGSKINKNWCPATRNHSQSTDNLDYLGVYVEIEHDSLTHFGFGDMTIHRTSVFRLEPKYGGA